MVLNNVRRHRQEVLRTSVRAWHPGGMTEGKPYPTDVSDGAWSFAAPYLTLMSEDVPQRRCGLREMFNALCWMARTLLDHAHIDHVVSRSITVSCVGNFEKRVIVAADVVDGDELKQVWMQQFRCGDSEWRVSTANATRLPSTDH